MAATVTVLCAVRGAAETDVVLALGEPGANVLVTRRCGDVVELLAGAQAGAGAVALVSGDLPGLDRETVARLHAADVRVVALADGAAPDRLRALGADVVVEGVVGPAVVARLAGVVRDAATALPAGRSDRPATGALPVAPAGTGPGTAEAADAAGTAGPEGADEAGDGPHPGARAEARPRADAPRDDAPEEGAAQGDDAPGRVVAVWGPVGAPGRSTVALELAAELAGLAGAASRRGRRGTRAAAAPAVAPASASGAPSETGPGSAAAGSTAGAPHPAADPRPALLVDADTYGSSLSVRLGLLDDAPGIAAVARAAGQGTLDLPTLARHSPFVAPNLRVLTGLTRAARWPELPGSSLEVVLERARELAAWTVVDTAALLETDELLMYDTHAPQRNAATLAALAAADAVVVVGAADPVGIQRLVRGLEELREVSVPVGRPAAVVVNRARASAVGPRPEAAVREAMARYAGLEDVVVVPDDQPALDAALLAGRTLAEHAPASPARTAIAAVAERLRAGVPVG
ncbi:hypothetical protein DNL40_15995 [Xylanimonas oleitrophica]|uniref:MinD-like ATPase involved in chromosome partitioning or flagellar assembly n=1 Tax=Xylanimonas oleitrophica TaxID=2607479 RepID=A0A2W5WKF4_9MICO|nr:hypothetical protein [Xylanimonas oleitrophica]PZR51542.1 hypothetical protein DNL40_15995 [Xylanimonas oleitrophica]